MFWASIQAIRTIDIVRAANPSFHWATLAAAHGAITLFQYNLLGCHALQVSSFRMFWASTQGICAVDIVRAANPSFHWATLATAHGAITLFL